jgi:outer membrane protein TolC
MREIVVFLVVLVACCRPGPVAAGERDPLDLAALLDEAERASPELLALGARAEATAHVAPQRETLPDPKLSVAYTNDGLTAFTLGTSEFTNLAVGWEQELPARTVRKRAGELERARFESLRATRASASARLRARVVTLYAELWRLDRTRSLVKESRSLLTTAVEAAKARYESGEGIQEGLIRAQSAVRRADLDIEELSLARRQAEIALGAALGRREDPAFGVADALPSLSGPLDGEELAAAAESSSPAVLQSTSLERTAAAELEDARARTKPDTSWIAAYQFRGGLDPMIMGGFSIRLPVFKDRKQEEAIAGAAMERTAAAHDREEAEVRARAGARGLAADVASIDARQRLFREAIVPQAQAAFESASASFSSGRAELSLVLDDLNRWIGVRREELALSAQRIETAAALEAATGTTLLTIAGPGRLQ